MTNEEKREYLVTWHRLLMKHHDAVEVDYIPNQQAIKGYDEFLRDFFEILYEKQPKAFYRYRSYSDQEVNNLRDDIAHFSHPDQFDDSLDMALNVDLDAEIEKVLGPNGDAKLKRDFSVSFVLFLLAKSGIKVDKELVENALDKVDAQGWERGLQDFYGGYLDSDVSSQLYAYTDSTLESLANDKLKQSVLGWVNNFRDVNKKTRAASYNLCLAEEYDNDAMWGTYASSCTGFCIRYEFPKNRTEGVMILSNLFPIYYGTKDEIRIVDLLMNGVFNPSCERVFHGLTQSDYERILLSSYTKLPIWEYQKEWRVTYGAEANQHFPFATAIYLGEKMKTEHRNTLIAIAKKKGLSIFERKLNRSGSKIIYEQIK